MPSVADVTRRDMLRLLGGAAVLRCASAPPEPKGHLSARPREVVKGGGAGLFPLGLAVNRDGLLYVPREGRLPLFLMLHGAGGAARRVMERFRPLADEFGFILLVPDSRDRTWDIIQSGYGPDVLFIDRALDRVFGAYDVERRQIAIGGFSDGASYALSLGITNGDLFTHIIAFSPGFAVPASQHGSPRIFISHGTEDTILPVENTRRMVRQLRSARFDLRYDEFRGPHQASEEIARAAFGWFTESSSRSARTRM